MWKFRNLKIWNFSGFFQDVKSRSRSPGIQDFRDFSGFGPNLKFRSWFAGVGLRDAGKIPFQSQSHNYIYSKYFNRFNPSHNVLLVTDVDFLALVKYFNFFLFITVQRFKSLIYFIKTVWRTLFFQINGPKNKKLQKSTSFLFYSHAICEKLTTYVKLEKNPNNHLKYSLKRRKVK